jgi:hypothetical protein
MKNGSVGLALTLSSIAAAMLMILFLPIGMILDALGTPEKIKAIAALLWLLICFLSGIYGFVRLYRYFQGHEE